MAVVRLFPGLGSDVPQRHIQQFNLTFTLMTTSNYKNQSCLMIPKCGDAMNIIVKRLVQHLKTSKAGQAMLNKWLGISPRLVSREQK